MTSKLQETISVLDFGADPTGTFDSTAAFTSAVAALSSGSRLWIPCGTYRINPTSSLIPVSGTIIQGAGPYCTNVLFTGSTATPVWLANNYVNGTGGKGQFLKFEDFTMSGNSVASSVCFSVGTTSTATAKVQSVTFDNMRITACNNGIQVNDVWDLNIIGSDLAFNVGDAIAITDPDAVTGLYIWGTRIHNNTGHAINNTGAGTVTQLEVFGGEETYSAGGAEIITGICRDCDFISTWTEEADAAHAQNAIDVTGCIECNIYNLHSNFANNVVFASAAVSHISISNSTAQNAQGLFVSVPTSSTAIDFGQNNRSNVGVSVGTATAQNTIDCPNATSFSLTSSTGLAVNACSGSDIVTYYANGTKEAFLSNVGNWNAKGMLSMSGSAFSTYSTGTSGVGALNSRNVADAFAVMTDNNVNVTSTGDIHDFQAAGVNQDGFTVQGIEFHRVGTLIASATTIAPIAPTTHITGTTPISTITPPTSCANAAQSGCTLQLIPDGAWTLVTGGNIAKASTAVAGQLMTLIYDPAQSKWYASY